MPFDLRSHTILLGLAGSRAQGLDGPDSDVDLRGVAIPPAAYFHGFVHTFAQADAAEQMAVFEDTLNRDEQRATSRTKLEGSVYNLVKFARLAADCNPNMLELLFCRDQELRLANPLGERLREGAPLFLSCKARHTFAGYATSQLRRIRGHRRWLLSPPAAPPQREDFGLPNHTLIPADQLAAAEAAIRKQMDEWEMDFGDLPPSEIVHIQGRIAHVLGEIMETTDARWKCAGRTLGMDDNLIAVLEQERRYGAAHRNWKQYTTWKNQRNPERARLEEQHGYDTKHGAHLVRLLRMGREILTEGKVHVWRGDRDADELRAIRAGDWSYDRLVSWAEAEDRAQGEILERGESPLPTRPDREAVDGLVQELVALALAG